MFISESYVLNKNVLKSAEGDDNLRVDLYERTKKNQEKLWMVMVFKNGQKIGDYRFDDRESADSKFEEIKKGFKTKRLWPDLTVKYLT